MLLTRRARPMSGRGASALGAAALLMALLVALLVPALPPASGVTNGVVTAGDTSAVSSISWHPCGGRFQCGTLTVPLDETAPSDSVDLAVIRARARDAESRIGSLVINPGGPGVPAVEFLRNVAGSLPSAVRDRFDLVAFDPRGVGASSPIECTTSLDPYFDQSFEPATSEARAALVEAATAVARDCAVRNGKLLAHVSTADAVRDLERLRLALGEERISYLGYSYGTLLGASYAQAHPERVRAFVLDGPVDPSLSARDTTLAQARGFEHSLDDFLADCSADRRCAFHHGGRPAAAYDALRARAAHAPLPVEGADGRTLNQTRFDAAVLQQLYLGRSAWLGLAEALAAADAGDASSLLAGADTFVGRDAQGYDDHVLEAFWAVTCLDGPVIAGVADATELERAAIAVAPRLGAFIVNNSLPCSLWPVPPRPPLARLTASGAPPILVVGTTEDPATPLAQARRLASTLARGRLLVAVGEQHTSFDNGNPCVDTAVTRYLVERRVPSVGTRC